MGIVCLGSAWDMLRKSKGHSRIKPRIEDRPAKLIDCLARNPKVEAIYWLEDLPRRPLPSAANPPDSNSRGVIWPRTPVPFSAIDGGLTKPDRSSWDIRLIGCKSASCDPRVAMNKAFRTAVRRPRISKAEWESLFFRFLLPLGVVVNLALGILILTGLKPQSWSDWLQVITGAFCCLVAGLLAAAAWSKSYWSRAMTRQVTVWRKIADTFFVWLEDAPLPPEALTQLKTSLDEVVPIADQRKESIPSMRSRSPF